MREHEKGESTDDKYIDANDLDSFSFAQGILRIIVTILSLSLHV